MVDGGGSAMVPTSPSMHGHMLLDSERTVIHGNTGGEGPPPNGLGFPFTAAGGDSR
jgi:hypothetical protein